MQGGGNRAGGMEIGMWNWATVEAGEGHGGRSIHGFRWVRLPVKTTLICTNKIESELYVKKQVGKSFWNIFLTCQDTTRN
jgi:hypothetical protein